MSTVNLVSSLMGHGKSLAKQLDKAKIMFEKKNKAETVPKPVENNIYDEVEKVINGLIKDLDELYDDEYTTTECFDKVARKTISSLEELKKHDDPQYASKYEALVTKVGKFLLSLATDVGSTLGTSISAHNDNNGNDIEDNNDNAQDTHINLKDSYQRLNFPQKSLLQLFAMLPRGTNIKKNDLVLWWSTLSGSYLDPINFDGEESDFQKDLRELAEMKVIEPVVMTGVESVRKNNKREGVKYKMPNVIWSEFHDQTNEFAEIRIKKINCFSLSRYKVVNTDACNLTTERLNMLTKGTFLVMQLGNWNHDPAKYIVVEDVDSLRNVLKAQFLSLEGVSGLVSLPYLSETLKVLILKFCNNLESLSQFNNSPKWLFQYLDMSECYQLDHPSDVLDGCWNLRVVKGFVLPQRQSRPYDFFISNPSKYTHLWKLALRTRRLNFPTNSDLETLCELQSLTHLKITWVGACSGGNNQQAEFNDGASEFPPKLTKFEMEAASESTSTKILDLIAQQKKKNIPIPLKKLYVNGGNLSKLNPDVDCKILRLHYLPNMQFDCYDMMRTFPELHRVEMSKDVMYSMLLRSFQKATGTNDQNSGWEPSLNPLSPPPAS